MVLDGSIINERSGPSVSVRQRSLKVNPDVPKLSDSVDNKLSWTANFVLVCADPKPSTEPCIPDFVRKDSRDFPHVVMVVASSAAVAVLTTFRPVTMPFELTNEMLRRIPNLRPQMDLHSESSFDPSSDRNLMAVLLVFFLASCQECKYPSQTHHKKLKPLTCFDVHGATPDASTWLSLQLPVAKHRGSIFFFNFFAVIPKTWWLREK